MFLLTLSHLYPLPVLFAASRFFTYNNGISTTAKEIVTENSEDGGLMITSFTNLQIINGGQTTATLAATSIKNNADLSGIYVQMKLTVLKDADPDLIRFIATYANSQNKVKTADLHKSFAVLTKEQQKYAKIFLTDVQQGNIVVEEDKTLIDYINQYQTEALNDRIHQFASAISVDEEFLRTFMERRVTVENINEFGLFDRLKATVDKDIAKAYFEKIEGQVIKPFRVPAKVDTALRKFILSGGHDTD